MTITDIEAGTIHLDVGGVRYEVSCEALDRFEGSMLASLISDQWIEDNTIEPIFIDREGQLFEYVLDYLQTGKVFLPRSVSLIALEKEFEYYGIDADMTNVHDLYGFEHLRMIKEEIGVQEAHLEMLKSEALAIQLCMFTELEYLKHLSHKSDSVNFDIPRGYENYNKRLFKECLSARGLVYVRGTNSDTSFEIAKQVGGDEDTTTESDE